MKLSTFHDFFKFHHKQTSLYCQSVEQLLFPKCYTNIDETGLDNHWPFKSKLFIYYNIPSFGAKMFKINKLHKIQTKCMENIGQTPFTFFPSRSDHVAGRLQALDWAHLYMIPYSIGWALQWAELAERLCDFWLVRISVCPCCFLSCCGLGWCEASFRSQWNKRNANLRRSPIFLRQNLTALSKTL